MWITFIVMPEKSEEGVLTEQDHFCKIPNLSGRHQTIRLD
jgi:hypothetical protein